MRADMISPIPVSGLSDGDVKTAVSLESGASEAHARKNIESDPVTRALLDVGAREKRILPNGGRLSAQARSPRTPTSGLLRLGGLGSRGLLANDGLASMALVIRLPAS